jgi:5-hydroxyisourate hydrolase
VAETRPTISTHVLDVGTGRPAVGVKVRLMRVIAGVESVCGQGASDHDGRIGDLLAGTALEAGDYRIRFDIDEGGFFRAATIDFRVTDTSRSYHVPLIRAPYSLSTYRGS